MITNSIYFHNDLSSINDGLLYHYTTTKSFFKILDSLCLKPSRFGNLNDLNEGSLLFYLHNDFQQKMKAREIINNECSMLSFTKSYESHGCAQSGDNRPSMWAYYANSTDGVCIVLNEEQFRAENKHIIDKYYGRLEDVNYDFQNIKGQLEDNGNALDTIKCNYQKLFFTKHEDWIKEDERRLVLIGLDPDKEMLSIKNSIAYITLGQKFWANRENIQHILERVANPNHICYKKFIPHSFAMTTNFSSGYWITDAAFQFHKDRWLKKKQEDNIEKYFEWLEKEGR